MARHTKIFDLADGFVVVACLVAVLALEFRDDVGIFGWLRGQTSEPVQQAASPVCPAPDPARWAPAIFGPGSRPLAADGAAPQAAVLQQFRPYLNHASYFGAVATGPDGASGSSTGFARRDLARRVALQRCEALGRGTCALLFEVLPKISIPTTTAAPCANTLSATQETAWNKLRTGTGPRAFARAGSRAWGAGATAAQAMAACNRMLATEALDGLTICETVALRNDQPTPPPDLPLRRGWTQEEAHIPPKGEAIPQPVCKAVPPAPYAPRVFAGPGTLRRVQGAPLPDAAQQALDALGKESWFGAFATAYNGRFAAVSGYGRRSEARAAALAQCQPQGPGCTVVAELLPVTQNPIGDCDETLSAGQAAGHLAFRQATGVRAFARALDGSWGAGKGKTLKEAAVLALGACVQMSRSRFDGVLGPCEIVDGYEGDRQAVARKAR